MNSSATREGIGIALDALRSNKVRAFLTTLGIVIGVATVMTMAAVITGFRAMVMEGIEAIGPNNFIVSRFDPTALSFSGDGEDPTEGKPALTFPDAEMLEALPAVRAVATSIDAGGDVRAGAREVSGVQLMGRSADWVEYSKGDFVQGNNFLSVHDQRASNIAVLSPDLAEQLFPNSTAVGRLVRIKGREFRVAGVYKLKDNIFASAVKNWVVVPSTTAIKDLGADHEWMDFLVVTERGYTQERAMDDVTAALRSARGLRPAQENNFALIKQEAFKAMFDRITGVFFIVMVVLSSIGLLVGGVGVVGIMMISVTERTREIGVRKALGAKSSEILWQFLVESTTVTVIGGAIGLAVATTFAMLISAATPVNATIPVWAIFASIMASGGAGILFGLYPAGKAARLDPVEALRHE
ncbi:MAG: ABC transporter permease [Gemmatimonadetes bacterium]|nr:ABC transporter permease [Gemmatimonadota bacterium]